MIAALLIVTYVVVALAWGRAVVRWASDRKEPDAVDGAMGTFYGLIWPVTIPMALFCFLIMGRVPKP